MNILRSTAVAAAALFAFLNCVTSHAAEQTAATQGLPGQRVFVTAHSFHIFIAQRLNPLVKAAGIEGHQLAGSQMIGGSRVIQHWNLPDDKNKAKTALAT